MTLLLTGFCAGSAAFYAPDEAVLPAVLALALVLVVSAILRGPREALAAMAAAAIGWGWAALHAELRLADRLSADLEGRDLVLVGTIATLASVRERSIRFEFEPEGGPAGLPRRVLLYWYRPNVASHAESDADQAVRMPRAGERWRFGVRLRQPRGLANPGGFDWEAWLYEHGIGATGYVRAFPPPQRLGERWGLLLAFERAREVVRERFRATLGERTPAEGILVALAVGDQRAIATEEWRLFNRTGVTHLMSISGLHVTLVSGLAGLAVAAAWRRSPWLLARLAARRAAALAAVAAALGYALLCGFAVPARRTFLMVSVACAALWFGRVPSAPRVLALAAAVVLATDPPAALAPGFWLSFGAVALIFWVARPGMPKPFALARVQGAMSVGLAPASLLFFGHVSLVGPLANAVAIPVVSLVVTPLALLAAALPFEFPLALAAWILEWLLLYLEWCAALPAGLWRQASPPWSLVAIALAGVAWLTAPRGVPWRPAGLALLAPAFAWQPAPPAPGTAEVTVLDAGQGLAVVVRTASRTLAYDAGPRFGPESDGGERIVLPYLQQRGVTVLDAMVVTHADSDHAGGAGSLLAAFETPVLYSSLPARHPLQALVSDRRACVRGVRWSWDGVDFEFLHPPGGYLPRRANDASCVLRISAGRTVMLLTGDIERSAEALLVAAGAEALRADVLLVPHHASASSSSPAFVAAVRPRIAVVPVGYRSRYGHPRPEVIERYEQAGAKVLRTDRDGAVGLRLAPEAVHAYTERERRRRPWHARHGRPAPRLGKFRASGRLRLGPCRQAPTNRGLLPDLPGWDAACRRRKAAGPQGRSRRAARRSDRLRARCAADGPAPPRVAPRRRPLRAAAPRAPGDGPA